MNSTLSEVKAFLKTRTGQLALTYLAIIMAMTVIFSIVIFAIASNQFDRPLPQHGTFRGGMYGGSNLSGEDSLEMLLAQRAAEARLGLFVSLLFLNVGVLLFGVWFSVRLARQTMEPIEEAMDEQSRFVSDASHELRTPLTALQSMNEVALRRKKITEEDARELAAANVEQAAKLHALTSSLLGLVTAGKQVPKLEAVDLQSTVGDAMASVVTAAQQKDVQVEDNVPSISVTANPDQLVQVIRILLDNAVKYSKKGGRVMIDADATGERVRLRVTDKGVGISRSDLPHIFSRFYRADSSRSKEEHDGYGLGLAIAKSISDQMQWSITATSTKGKGSSFSIDLPLAPKN